LRRCHSAAYSVLRVGQLPGRVLRSSTANRTEYAFGWHSHAPFAADAGSASANAQRRTRVSFAAPYPGTWQPRGRCYRSSTANRTEYAFGWHSHAPFAADAGSASANAQRRSRVACAAQTRARGRPTPADHSNSITWRMNRLSRIAANASSTSSRAIRRSISRWTGSRPSLDHAAYRGKSIAGSAEP
jgi:hypothetical protein